MLAMGLNAKKSGKCALNLIFIAISAVSAGAAIARDAVLEEVLVTATMREVTAQSVPESIAVVSGRDLESAGIVNFSGLTSALPGVELRTLQPGFGSVAIRGVSELNSDILYGNTGSAVGFYLDEAPLTMAGRFPDFATFDMARVEVLKGPQGTLYGEGSLAGTVRLISNRPDPEGFSASIQGTYSDTRQGSDNTGLSGMVNVPLMEDGLALRLVATHSDDSGFIDSRDFVTGELTRRRANSAENTTLRGSVLWLPTDNTEAQFTYGNSQLDLGGNNLGTRERYNAISVAEPTDDEVDMYNLVIRHRIASGEFVSSSTWLDRSIDSIRDQGGLTDPTNMIFGLFGVPITVDGVFIGQTIEVDAFAQEFRFVSDLAGPMNFTVGGFYKDHDSRFAFSADGVPNIGTETWQLVSNVLFGFPIPDALSVDSRASTEQWALFGELSWELSDRLSLIAGGRYFDEDRDSVTDFGGAFLPLLGGPFPGSSASSGSDNLFNPKVTLKYNFNQDVMVYGSYSEGFRSGGQNDLFVLIPGSSPDYDSETLESYELGLKSGLWDDRLRLNAALYRMNWNELQAIVAEGPGGIGEVVGNVGDAHTNGLDLELRALVLPGLEITAAGSWLEAETDDEYLAPDPAGGDPLVVPRGVRIPGTSERSFTLATEYGWDLTGRLEGFLRASYSYTGDSVDQIVRQEKVPAYELVNVRAGVVADSWRFTLFVDNLLDEDTWVQKSSTPDSLGGGDHWYWGRPRTVGATLRFDF
jgi:outer membrane receptor protein involved in Fe transport